MLRIVARMAIFGAQTTPAFEYRYTELKNGMSVMILRAMSDASVQAGVRARRTLARGDRRIGAPGEDGLEEDDGARIAG
ncbi:MAG: hypothetical protein M0037_06125 [Betaproteobacteria bacterium]|nr:hypothetical protein [Betaproteobacteria bacterium]